MAIIQTTEILFDVILFKGVISSVLVPRLKALDEQNKEDSLK